MLPSDAQALYSEGKMYDKSGGMKLQQMDSTEYYKDNFLKVEKNKFTVPLEEEEKTNKKNKILLLGAVGGCILVIYLVGSLIISTDNK